MLKNLLYLYNDGHNPFPNMTGYGGLGYHLPQYRKRMHGTSVVNQGNGEFSFYDDGYDYEFSKDGFIDGPIPDHLREEYDMYVEERRSYLLGDKLEDQPQFNYDSKLSHNDIHDNDYMLLSDKYEQNQNDIESSVEFRLKEYERLYPYEILSDEDKEKIFKNIYKNKIKSEGYINIFLNDIKKAIKEEDIEPEINEDKKHASEIYDQVLKYNDENPKKFDNLGTAYEGLLTETRQDFLKEITESTDEKHDFKDAKKSDKFYENGDMNKPLKDYLGRNLYDLAPIDLYDSDVALEVKNNYDKDYIQIQGSKFYGTNFSKPYYTQNSNGEWKLYNIWHTQLSKNGDWIYKKSNKKLNVLGLLDDGEYLYDMTEVFEDFVYDESDKKGKNGETLYVLVKDEFQDVIERDTDRDGDWFKIKKNNNGIKKLENN